LARQQAQNSETTVPLHNLIEISGKVVEEVGFEKIRKQLAELQELRIVLLDGFRISGLLAYDQGPGMRQEELRRLGQTCLKIVELDLSRNLFQHWIEIHDICKSLKQLKSLKLK
jgi:tubulin-specific chaperone E